MYFVNRSEIEQLLENLDQVLAEVKNREMFQQDRLHQLALERIMHMMIESILDVGNKMIDGFIMRDPGSYHDIIDILIDEKVLPEEEADAYKRLIDARQMIVRDYAQVNHDSLLETMFSGLQVWRQFSTRIRTYLDEEMGVANTFTNETKE